jgi:electron transfer flavoprotein alpha subunit
VGGTVEAVAWGPDVEKLAGPLGEYGATTVYDVGDLAGALAGVPVAAAIVALIEGGNTPAAILIPASYDGRDVAGRLSAKLDRPVLTNVTGLLAEGDGLASQHPVFGGSHIVTARFTGGGPGIFVIRAKSFAAEPSGGAAATVQAAPVPDVGSTNTAKVEQSHVEERSGPKLDEAAVVVSGGRGLGEAANYALIEELAKLLHGAAGASRAIVDAGWVPYSHQVGQTGKTVKPTVYVACGISGATQHMVGMKGSKNIVAVNKDRDAPIFSIADLGIVGDVHKVLPALIEALTARG